MIDLHSIVAFFHKAKWSELTIRHEINRVLGENIISYSTVRKYMFGCLSYQWKKQTLLSSPSRKWFQLWRPHRPCAPRGAISFSSQIVENVTVSKSIVCCHLTQTMRWKLRDLKWVPHRLTESEKLNQCKEQQNSWSFYSRSDTKGGNILSLLTSHRFIGKSTESSSGFQRMMSRE
jgi:hypothetical protein